MNDIVVFVEVIFIGQIDAFYCENLFCFDMTGSNFLNFL